MHRARHAMAPLAQQMCADHGRADVLVTEQLVNGADIVVGLKQVCGEGIAEGMTAHMLDSSRLADRLLDCRLEDRLVGMMAAFLYRCPLAIRDSCQQPQATVTLTACQDAWEPCGPTPVVGTTMGVSPKGRRRAGGALGWWTESFPGTHRYPDVEAYSAAC